MTVNQNIRRILRGNPFGHCQGSSVVFLFAVLSDYCNRTFCYTECSLYVGYAIIILYAIAVQVNYIIRYDTVKGSALGYVGYSCRFKNYKGMACRYIFNKVSLKANKRNRVILLAFVLCIYRNIAYSQRKNTLCVSRFCIIILYAVAVRVNYIIRYNTVDSTAL